MSAIKTYSGIVEIDEAGKPMRGPAGPSDAELLAEAREMLADLVEWDSRQGGYEAGVWRRAKALLARLRGEVPDAPVPLPADLVGRLYRVQELSPDEMVMALVETATEAHEEWDGSSNFSLIEAESLAAAAAIHNAYLRGDRTARRIETRGWPDADYHPAEFQYLAWAPAVNSAAAS